MPIKLLSTLDGTDRPISDNQREYMTWVEQNWDKAEVIGLQLPTGSRKSYLARTIQRATNARVISGASNLLMDQYTATYPDVNALKGASHYACKDHAETTCEDRKEMGERPCEGCPYRACRRAAIEGKPTFFNPMSLYYLQRDSKYKKSRVLVVDEAHTLIDMLLTLSGKRLPRSKYGAPVDTDQLSVCSWLRELVSLTRSAAETAGRTGDMRKFITLQRELDGLLMTLDGLENAPQNYVLYSESGEYRGRPEEFFNIKPVVPYNKLIRQFLDADKVVLMSATLFKHDFDLLTAGRPSIYYDSRSPIPVANRRIRYAPIPGPMNRDTPAQVVVEHVLGLLNRHPGENAVIHASYAQALKWGPLLRRAIPGLITHTSEDKEYKLETFKTKGGVFLASGCAEGIDLPGDLCRVNIIPSLLKLNPTDAAVKKRMAMEGGRAWYELEALKTLVQQAGRSTRGASDRSVIYVCDPQFPTYFVKNKDSLPISFTEAISWSKERK
jgi:Rad3-related DNA helicase